MPWAVDKGGYLSRHLRMPDAQRIVDAQMTVAGHGRTSSAAGFSIGHHHFEQRLYVVPRQHGPPRAWDAVGQVVEVVADIARQVHRQCVEVWHLLTPGRCFLVELIELKDEGPLASSAFA